MMFAMSETPTRDRSDRPNRIPWPPVLDALTIVGAVLLQRVWPLPPLVEVGPLRLLGWLVCIAGISVACAGVLHFRQVRTPVDPTGRATAVATGGIYAWTRNPMYLGTLLALVGLGLAWPQTWLVLLVPLLAFGLVNLAITREEAFLERRFGDDYLAYKVRVRRWI
jgi:protein-S-isoprenylcysteine O-methyltransferase Ste14